MRMWSSSLFTAGLPGAWSFPWVVPLAAIGQGLSDMELKALSRAIRKQVVPDGRKFTAGPASLAPLPFSQWDSPGDKQLFAFGPSLDIALPETATLKPISPTVLGAALLYGPPPDDLPAPPQIAFRAAALAIMRFSALAPGGEYSFEWEIGKLHWLPKQAKIP